jgi:hypothetical protein
LIRPASDLRLLVAPSETYRKIGESPADSRAALSRAVARVVAPAIIAGITTAVAATGRISWSLAATGAACWSFLAPLQIVTAAAVILPANRRVTFPRALELFFLGHAAWSLWLVLSAAVLLVAPGGVPLDAVLLSALVPLVWTAIVIRAFFREVLQLERRRAAMWTAIHQALTVLVIVLYVGWAVQLWPRVLALRAP